jgi:hypothetical protein
MSSWKTISQIIVLLVVKVVFWLVKVVFW